MVLLNILAGLGVLFLVEIAAILALLLVPPLIRYIIQTLKDTGERDQIADFLTESGESRLGEAIRRGDHLERPTLERPTIPFQKSTVH